MSLLKKHETSLAEVCHYLAHHPDFFVSRPELLQQLSIPHDAVNRDRGHKVSSLLEYQIGRLKKQLLGLEKDHHNLHTDISDQRRLARNLHELVLQLLPLQSADDLYHQLQAGLKQYCAADRLIVLMFGAANSNAADCHTDHADFRRLQPSSRLRFMFTELFHRGKPLCNSLQEEHLEALFGCDTAAIQSTAMLPVSDGERQLLLVLGSQQANRYQQGIELDLLLFVGQILQTQLQRFA